MTNNCHVGSSKVFGSHTQRILLIGIIGVTLLGSPCRPVAKLSGEHLTAMELIDQGKIDLVIIVPREYDSLGRIDGYLI